MVRDSCLAIVQCNKIKVCEIHGLNVPRDVVYAVMKEVSPERLQARGGVGKAKWHRRTNTFVTGLSGLLPVFYLK